MEKNEALKLGRFFCEELLGNNGTTETFRARLDDLRGLEQKFAVKLLRPDRGGDDPKIAAKFVEAGRRAAALTDPGIVRVTEVSGEKTAVFVVSEFVDGLDLHYLAEETRGTTGKAVDAAMVTHIGVSAAQALAAAHGRADAVLHLGLCPRNVMLTAAGEVKLLDFGLAAAVRDRATDDVARWLYVAPELLAGGKGSARSDLYSLGAVLYELLMGRPPFSAGSIDELEKLARRPPLMSLPTATESLAKAIRAMLAAKPEDRPESANAAVLMMSGVSDIRKRLSQVVAVVRGGEAMPDEPAARRKQSDTLLGTGEPPAEGGAKPAGAERPGARLTPLVGAGMSPAPPGGAPIAQLALRKAEVPQPGTGSRRAPARIEEVQGVVFDPTGQTGAAVVSEMPIARPAAPPAPVPAGDDFDVSSLSAMGGELVVEIEGEPAVPAFDLDPGKGRRSVGASTAVPAFGDAFFDVPSSVTPDPRRFPKAGVRPDQPPGTAEPVLSFDDGIVRSSSVDVSEFLGPSGKEYDQLSGEPLETRKKRSLAPAATGATPAVQRPPERISLVGGGGLRGSKPLIGSARVESRLSQAQRAGLENVPAATDPWYSPRRFLIPIVLLVSVPAGVVGWWVLIEKKPPADLASLVGKAPPPRPAPPTKAPPTPRAGAPASPGKLPGSGAPAPTTVASTKGAAGTPPAAAATKVAPAAPGTAAAAPAPTSPPGATGALGQPPRPAPGQLVVQTDPAGAVVWIDGEEKGLTPLAVKVEEGGHRVVVIKEGFQSLKEVLDASDGEILQRKLEPGVKPPKGEAGMKVRCLTAGKFPVIVDGHETGMICPTERIDVTPGEHEVAIFVPKDREAYSARISFEPSRGSTRVHFKY